MSGMSLPTGATDDTRLEVSQPLGEPWCTAVFCQTIAKASWKIDYVSFNEETSSSYKLADVAVSMSHPPLFTTCPQLPPFSPGKAPIGPVVFWLAANDSDFIHSFMLEIWGIELPFKVRFPVNQTPLHRRCQTVKENGYTCILQHAGLHVSQTTQSVRRRVSDTEKKIWWTCPGMQAFNFIPQVAYFMSPSDSTR